MKKIYFLLSFALVMLAITSCSGGAASTPEGAVENVIDAIKDGDIKGVIACCCDSDGEPYDLDEMLEESGIDEDELDEQLEALQKQLKKKLGNADFEIGKAKYDDDDEDRATVKVTAKKGKKKDTNTFTCIKGSDDKWRVYLPM